MCLQWLLMTYVMTGFSYSDKFVQKAQSIRKGTYIIHTAPKPNLQCNRKARKQLKAKHILWSHGTHHMGYIFDNTRDTHARGHYQCPLKTVPNYIECVLSKIHCRMCRHRRMPWRSMYYGLCI